MDKISVVTICLNEEKNIKETLESVLNQTYVDIEYIIKDGGSMDGTNEIIKKTIECYKGRNIKHIIQKDAGIYDAMNQAIDYCTGDWVIFINAGDYFTTKEVLKKIFSSYTNADAGIIYGDAIVKDDDGEMVWKADIKKLPYKMPFCHQSCFIKKIIIEQKKFNNSYKIVADFNMILELYREGYKFKYIDEIVSVFDMAGISSNNFILKEKEHYKVLSEQGVKGLYVHVSQFIAILVAYIKKIINQYFPKKVKKCMRRFYKQNVKKYDTKEKFYN